MVIEIIKIIIKIVTFVIFCLLSSYVLLFGKEKSGIKIDYAFLVVVFLVCDTFVFTVSKAFAFTLAGVIAKQQIPRSTAVTVKILLNFPFIFNPSNFAL